MSGPVPEWGNCFLSASEISYPSSPDDAFLGIVPAIPFEHYIGGNVDFPFTVICADIDGDGDPDVFVPSYSGDKIILWINRIQQGESWLEVIVDDDANGARSVSHGDIDSDGDQDIIAIISNQTEVVWYENLDSIGLEWHKWIIEGKYIDPVYVYAEDLDLDGDIDVIGASKSQRRVDWWENPTGQGQGWIRHEIDGNYQSPKCLHPYDIDGDGDLDIVGSSSASNDKICWWRNEDESCTIWSRITIDTDFERAYFVDAGDIDGDGYPDVVGVGWDDSLLCWWRNVDGLGTSWEEFVVDDELFQAREVRLENMDGDGDLDLIACGSGWEEDAAVCWYDNLDSNGLLWQKHLVSRYNYASGVFPSDIDGNGTIDVVACADFDVRWWSITAYSGYGELHSSILDTDIIPVWAFIDWTAGTPEGTSVSFRVRGSDDPDNMGDWSDEITDPQVITNLLARYIQYMLILRSDNTLTTPFLHDITITLNGTGVCSGDAPALNGIRGLYATPNPSTALLTIAIDTYLPPTATLRLFDLSGRLICCPAAGEFHQGTTSFHVSGLAPGAYLMQLDSELGILTGKLLVTD